MGRTTGKLGLPDQDLPGLRINFDMILNCGVYYKDDVAQFDRALAHHEKLSSGTRNRALLGMLNSPTLTGAESRLWARNTLNGRS